MTMFGETLRQARAYKGVTLKEAEQATRINRHHLSALEDENFAALPPLIYQRGIVRNYAAYLDLDPAKLLSLFGEAHGDHQPANEPVLAMKPLDMPNHFTPNFAIIAFMVVMSAIVFAWLYSAYLAPPEALPTTAPVLTVTPIVRTAASADPIGATSTPTATATVDPDAPTATAEAEPTEPKATEGASRVTAAGTTSGPSARRATRELAPTEEPQPSEEPQPTAAPAEDVEATGTAEAASATEAAAALLAADAAESTADAAADAAEATDTAVDPDALALDFSTESPDGVYLSVLSEDGTVLFDGRLGPGESTGTLRAVQFTVWSSDIGSTLITNEGTGQGPFYMPGSGAGTISLP